MTVEKMNVAERQNSKKYCHTKYWYFYWQYFSKVVLVLVSAVLFARVLLLVLTTVFTSIVYIHAVHS